MDPSAYGGFIGIKEGRKVVKMTKRVIKEAFVKSLPVCAGYVVLGIGFGILLEKAGYGLPWALLMSVFIFAGSCQYVGVSLIAGKASLAIAAMTTFMVNARHLFYSISMFDKYKDAGKKKGYLIFGLTDETYSLLCDGTYPEGEDPHAYQFLVTLFDQIYWIAGSVVGSILGSIITFSTAGIEFSMTALFVTVFVEQWLTTKNHLPAVMGVAATAVCRVVFGSEIFLIPSMIVILVALSFMRKSMEDPNRTMERKEEQDAPEAKNIEPENAETKGAERKNAGAKNVESKDAERKNAESKNADKKTSQEVANHE